MIPKQLAGNSDLQSLKSEKYSPVEAHTIFQLGAGVSFVNLCDLVAFANLSAAASLEN